MMNFRPTKLFVVIAACAGVAYTVPGGSNFAGYRQLSQYDTYGRYGANSKGNAIQLCEAQAGLDSSRLAMAARA